MATQILDWSWDWGWDEEFGGIINFRDCRNFPPQDYSQDMKFWWPQCETVIATLYAYIATGNEKYLDMHRKANEWMYAHLPDAEYPEWYGYLHRDGSVAQPAKGNIFKRVRSTYRACSSRHRNSATRYSPCKRSHAPCPGDTQYRFILPATTTTSPSPREPPGILP